MPDLGKYAGAVLASYAATITLVVVLVLFSLWQSRRIKRALTKAQARQDE